MRWLVVLGVIMLLPFLGWTIAAHGASEQLTEITGQVSCPSGTAVQGVRIVTTGNGSGSAHWYYTQKGRSVARYVHSVEEPYKLGYFVSVGCGKQTGPIQLTSAGRWETSNMTIQIKGAQAAVLCNKNPSTNPTTTFSHGECTSTST